MFWWQRKQTLSAAVFLVQISQAVNNKHLPCERYRCIVSSCPSRPSPPHAISFWATWHDGFICLNILSQLCCVHSNKLPENTSSLTTQSPAVNEHINRHADNRDTFSDISQIDGYCCSGGVIKDSHDGCQPAARARVYTQTEDRNHINTKLVSVKCDPLLRHCLMKSD